MKRRETCLRCEQAGKRTPLIHTDRFGGVCPLHDESFLEVLRRNARARLGIPERDPRLARMGVPATARRNG